MKIDIVCNDGSPLGVTSKTVYGDHMRVGVGGAELGLLTMCEEWTKAGHQVTLYNDPWEANASPFEQRAIGAFEPSADRDIVINFRSPNIACVPAKGLKVWWSTDQFSVGDYAKFSAYMDKIVCISQYHAEYFARTYNIQNAIVIDLPVRKDDFDVKVSRIPHRFIFSSVPDRGLKNMWRMWPKIKQVIPDASIVITSDYRLWGTSSLNEKYRVMWMGQNSFEFLGAVNRKRYIEELMKSDIFFYPCNYEELFCISCAEAQYAGLLPVTSAIGALSTTNMGYAVKLDADFPPNDSGFVDALKSALGDSSLVRKQLAMDAQRRFSPENILCQWDSKVFK